MSIALMTLAWKSEMPSGRKFVLVSLCDNANDQGECFPSMSTIAERCSMGERTVQGHIHDLIKTGVLAVQERAGRSNVYTIDPRRFSVNPDETHYVYKITDVASGQFYIGLRTCKGDAKKDGYMGSGAWFSERISDGNALQKTILQRFDSRDDAAKFERQSIVEAASDALCMNKRTPADSAPRNICTPQYLHPTPADSAPPPPQISHPTPADFAPITIKEPSIEPKGNQRKAQAPAVAKPDDVDSQVWADWLTLRKTKRAPVTLTVLDGALSESAKAGMTLNDFLKIWCERGSQGLMAEWLRPKERNQPTGETAYQRNMRERFEEASGRRTRVIDITPQPQRISA